MIHGQGMDGGSPALVDKKRSSTITTPVLQQQQGGEGPTLSQEGRCVGVTGEQLGQGLSLQPEKAQEGDQGWLPAPG